MGGARQRAGAGGRRPRRRHRAGVHTGRPVGRRGDAARACHGVDVGAAKPPAPIRGTSPARAMALSPDGKQVAVGGRGFELKLADVAARRDRPHAADADDGGRRGVRSRRRAGRRRAARSGRRCSARTPGRRSPTSMRRQPATAAAFSPQGDTLAIAADVPPKRRRRRVLLEARRRARTRVERSDSRTSSATCRSPRTAPCWPAPRRPTPR